MSGKTCSICGKWFNDSEFSYGGRDNRSYCKQCNKEEKLAYTRGGKEEAHRYREDMRNKWK
jgi:hypothetical protein